MITSAARRSIDSTNFWKHSTGMTCKVLAKATHNSVKLFGVVRWRFTPFSKISERFYIEFNSGLLGDQFMTQRSEKCSSTQPVAKRDL
ncbi:hypothetical protein TNCV_3622631 [Trichonephila clavipes]|nr:hypothetical protein TNCV_3622631 [Trichonephila clavipes]